jgi:hypothetical protein
MRVNFKIFFSFLFFLNSSFSYANLSSTEQPKTGKDALTILAATCSADHWASFQKWSRFDQFKSMTSTAEVAVFQNQQISFADSDISISQTSTGLELKAHRKIIRGSDYCELILNSDKHETAISIWQAFGFINQAWAEDKKSANLTKYILAAALSGSFLCAGYSLAVGALPIAAACGVVFAAAAVLTPQEKLDQTTAGVTLQPESKDKLSFLKTKINSCSADQVIIENNGARLIATRANKIWDLKVIDLANDVKRSTKKTESQMVQARNHIYDVSKFCHTQADVDRINAHIDTLNSQARARIAKLESESKVSGGVKTIETSR